jgi:archaellum component FlaC
VPIILLDIKSTQNVFKKIEREFINWQKKKKISGVKSDIGQIDNKICELDSKIDDLVFSLYNLKKNEIRIIMTSCF